mmetsp:Transcript_28510/g.71201  ORF Transcript_28510/g.71201 Transcript_28510/m.71201 type:complete len:240 (+) Transcript_28510:922-1641(+)
MSTPRCCARMGMWSSTACRTRHCLSPASSTTAGNNASWKFSTPTTFAILSTLAKTRRRTSGTWSLRSAMMIGIRCSRVRSCSKIGANSNTVVANAPLTRLVWSVTSLLRVSMVLLNVGHPFHSGNLLKMSTSLAVATVRTSCSWSSSSVMYLGMTNSRTWSIPSALPSATASANSLKLSAAMYRTRHALSIVAASTTGLTSVSNSSGSLRVIEMQFLITNRRTESWSSTDSFLKTSTTL